MMRYYQMEGGSVIGSFELPQPGLELVLLPDGGSPGDKWIDGAWESSPEPLPALTARQLRLGLIAAGIPLASVEGAIAAIPDETDRAVAQVEWEYASQFERDHPLIEQVGAALGLTPEQIDAAWLAARNVNERPKP